MDMEVDEACVMVSDGGPKAVKEPDGEVYRK